MSINIDIRDPLVPGRLPARYLGYSRYKCNGCQGHSTHVVVVKQKYGKPKQFCQKCYWSDRRHYFHPEAA